MTLHGAPTACPHTTHPTVCPLQLLSWIVLTLTKAKGDWAVLCLIQVIYRSISRRLNGPLQMYMYIRDSPRPPNDIDPLLLQALSPPPPPLLSSKWVLLGRGGALRVGEEMGSSLSLSLLPACQEELDMVGEVVGTLASNLAVQPARFFLHKK